MPPASARMAPAKSPLLGALAGALGAAGDDRSWAVIAGLTGLGFGHRVSPGLGPEAWAGFSWASELVPALHGLGYPARVHFAPAGDPMWLRVLDGAIDDIEREVTAGRAAIAWGIQVAAFGLVRGIDRERGRLAVSGVLDGQGGATEIAIADLGGGEAPALFVIALGERAPIDPGAALDAALVRAVRELSGAVSVEGSSIAGLAAHDLAIASLQRGDFDPSGAALGLAIAGEARSLAAEWLRGLGGEAALATAADAAWQASGALAAACRVLPFPPPRGLDIGGDRRAEVVAALERARAADAALLRHIGAALDRRRHGAAAALQVEHLAPADAGELYRCLADVPLVAARSSESRCRDVVAPRLGRDFHALAARDAAGRVRAHLYYAPLERSFYPIRADRPVLLLFCAWVARDLRGRGLGRRLCAALREHARALGAAGVLAESTELDVFLPEASWRALGFREIEREGPMRLGYLPADDTDGGIQAAWIPPAAAGSGLTVRHAPNCPLLDAVRRAAAHEARAAGLPVDEGDATGPEAGVTGSGRRLPNTPLPPGAYRLLVVD